MLNSSHPEVLQALEGVLTPRPKKQPIQRNHCQLINQFTQRCLFVCFILHINISYISLPFVSDGANTFYLNLIMFCVPNLLSGLNCPWPLNVLNSIRTRQNNPVGRRFFLGLLHFQTKKYIPLPSTTKYCHTFEPILVDQVCLKKVQFCREVRNRHNQVISSNCLR